MLAGDLPFDGPEPMAIFMNILNYKFVFCFFLIFDLFFILFYIWRKILFFLFFSFFFPLYTLKKYFKNLIFSQTENMLSTRNGILPIQSPQKRGNSHKAF